MKCTTKSRASNIYRSEFVLNGSNRPFSYSGKESESNDVMMHFEEFSNVHNSDRTSNATRSNRTSRIKLYKNNARSRLFSRIAKRSIAASLSAD